MENTKVVELHKKQSVWVYGETEGILQKLTVDFTGWELKYDVDTLKLLSINKVGESDDTSN